MTNTAGTRLPDADLEGDGTTQIPGPGWTAWANGTCAPGSYMKVHQEGSHTTWWFVDPTGSVGSLSEDKVVENEDGTITVEQEIDVPPHGFRGTIQKGVWQQS